MFDLDIMFATAKKYLRALVLALWLWIVIIFVLPVDVGVCYLVVGKKHAKNRFKENWKAIKKSFADVKKSITQ